MAMSAAEAHSRALDRAIDRALDEAQRGAPRGGRDDKKKAAPKKPVQQKPTPKPRPSTPADSSILSRALRDRVTGGGGSYRGSVLSALYGLPGNADRAVRTLQSFNGNQSRSLVLGR